jgi:hypothetical protein
VGGIGRPRGRRVILLHLDNVLRFDVRGRRERSAPRDDHGPEERP